MQVGVPIDRDAMVLVGAPLVELDCKDPGAGLIADVADVLAVDVWHDSQDTPVALVGQRA